jgi:hypothetical protein
MNSDSQLKVYTEYYMIVYYKVHSNNFIIINYKVILEYSNKLKQKIEN